MKKENQLTIGRDRVVSVTRQRQREIISDQSVDIWSVTLYFQSV